jgi:hypothetical protein
MTVKHGGCAMCKSKDQEILKSTTVGANSISLCDNCRKAVK